MGLDQEIMERRAEVRSDGYSMSIGELINLYRDGELDIHPEFQRFYRWSGEQKSRLVESILLGIPIPSLFVSQREDGVWDVIDGLQRLSTIFELVGELRDSYGRKHPALTLSSTRYLPSLEGKRWGCDRDGDRDGESSSIGVANQLLIRRSKIDVKIILRESSESTKYELFQRLNSGGTKLSGQELRNAILVMVNPEAYRWIDDLAKDESFQSCLPITERDRDEQYDLELVTRFVIFRRLGDDQLKSVRDLGEFLDDRIADFAQSEHLSRAMELESNAFRFTFEKLADSLGENSFRKYDLRRERYFGGFSISGFEPIAIGLGYHYETYRDHPDLLPLDFNEITKKLWSNRDFVSNSGSGVRASTRVGRNIPLGRQLFAP